MYDSKYSYSAIVDFLLVFHIGIPASGVPIHAVDNKLWFGRPFNPFIKPVICFITTMADENRAVANSV